MIRIAIIGYGKIAHDQHVPSLTANGGYKLEAVVTTVPEKGPPGVPVFSSADELLDKMAGQLDAVTISTPPGPRYDIARKCLKAGLDCQLEKPPTVTLGESNELAALAEATGQVLYTTWHSQHAAAVDQARDLLRGKRIASMRIVWREDVNKYHPGQDWVWDVGGFGVFDPGINALSVAERIMPGRLIVRAGEMEIPKGKQSPIAVHLKLASPVCDGPIEATFDWHPVEHEEWTIHVQPADGPEIVLTEGGAKISVGGQPRPATGPGEYPGIYARFAELVRNRQSEIDIEPLRLVADSFLVCRRDEGPAFEWTKKVP